MSEAEKQRAAEELTMPIAPFSALVAAGSFSSRSPLAARS